MNMTEYLDQDDIWLARGNTPVPIEFIDQDWARNIMAFLERRVTRYYLPVMMEALLDGYVGEYDDEMRGYSELCEYWIFRDKLEWLRSTKLYQAFEELVSAKDTNLV